MINLIRGTNGDALGILFFLVNLYFLISHPKHSYVYYMLVVGSVIGLLVDIYIVKNFVFLLL